VSQKRCGTLPARSSNVSRRGVVHHALARATRGGCAEGRSPFDKGLGRATSPSSSAVPRECRVTSLPRVWGCPPIPPISPKSGGQGVEFNSWVSPNPLGGAARVADEAPGECLERAAVGCAFALPTLRFGRVQGIRPCRGFGGILGAFNSPLQALSRDGVRLRRTRVRGAPESCYSSPKIGGQGVDR
jgi:hypothetical protein